MDTKEIFTKSQDTLAIYNELYGLCEQLESDEMQMRHFCAFKENHSNQGILYTFFFNNFYISTSPSLKI